MLTADNVSFGYRTRAPAVLDGLDWQVPVGRRVLLLGVNGAGKTTLLKLLSGFSSPKSGTISISGRAGPSALSEHVAWMPQNIAAVRGLTIQDQVAYAAWLSGIGLTEARKRATEAIAAVNLSELRSRPTHQLSGGQLRRVGLAEVLCTRAEVLLLDEPTAGLDPAQRQTFNEIIQGLPEKLTVVVSTHHSADLEGIYDDLAILAEGQIAFMGSGSEFRKFGETFGLAQDASVEQVFTHMVRGGSH